MLEALKVKIKSHVAEARIIRTSERASLRCSTDLRIRSRLLAADISERSIARIMKRAKARRVSVPRLVTGQPADALFGDKFKTDALPEYIDKHERQYGALRAHRVCEPVRSTAVKSPNGRLVKRDNSLRSETRHALLAYGFLRGRDFKRMEAKSYVPPNFRRIEEIARRFADWGDGGPIADQLFAQRFAEWKSAAGTWQHPDLAAIPMAAAHE